MMRTRVVTLLLASSLVACVGERARPQQPSKIAQNPAATAPAAELDPQALLAIEQELRAELEQIRNLRFVGMDGGPVPDFDVHTADGAQLSSKSLVGQRAFVVVFFATWCDSCEQQLKSLQRARHQLGPVRIIPVSMDSPETWTRVPDYLGSFEMREPWVRAADHPMFASSYNPFQMVPVLAIVGKNGGLVDYQLGYAVEQEQRLAASLRLAETIGPLAPDAPDSTL